MLTLWNGDKGGCSSEKPSQALQGSGLPEAAAPQSFSCALGAGESETDGGLGSFPKLRETVFTLTLVAEAGGVGAKKRPAKAAVAVHPPPRRPAAPFPSPSPVQSAGPQGSSRLSGLALQEQLGRRAPPEPAKEAAAGSGASAGISAAAVSLGLPPHPGGARAADAARPPSAAESGEGAGGGGWGAPLPPSRGGGGGLGAGDVPLLVPAAGRGAAGRRHRAQEPERSSPRRSPGAARDSRLRRRRRLQERQKGPGGWEGKSFLLGSRQIPTKPHAPSAEEAGWGLGAGGWGLGRGAGLASRRVTARSGPGSEPSSPPPTTRGNSPRSAAPAFAARLLLDDADKIRSSPSQVPSPPTGDPAAKLHFWSRDYHRQNLSVGTKYPLSGALLWAGRPEGGNGHTHPWGEPLAVVEPRVPEPRSAPRQSSGAIGEPLRIPGFP
ncbi:spidroin-1-like [Acinonyx jubatus]|uniref:Spidroin-1-like n=1 Tax=Acinonyx jubatus TaxID=32536 RepID=A0ABM3Q2S2_ACIJB|nr:spidroin-1-like [Acinonyx jubatus]